MDKMVKVTIRLPETLARLAKLHAMKHDEDLQDLVARVLQEALKVPLTIEDVLRPHVARAKRTKKARAERGGK